MCDGDPKDEPFRDRIDDGSNRDGLTATRPVILVLLRHTFAAPLSILRTCAREPRIDARK